MAQEEDYNPLEFYSRHYDSLPNIAKIARSLFAIPASTASVESAFSVASLSNGAGNKRVKLADISLENELILKYGKEFIKMFF